ncbi:MAG: hypothetical protein ACJ8G7_11155 [Rhizobacter sp.]
MSRPLRLLFWACCAWAVAAMWLAPHLPQIDLPQHAGQTALLREFALGRTPWPGELRVNLLTPYLIGYGALLGLSFVMSIESAIALVYSITFVAFVAACMSLRRELDGDERLDWLILPGFFGLPWQWGFLTFLGALPIGVYFLTISYRYSAEPTLKRGLALVALGTALLFSHGLVFLYAVPMGLVIGAWTAASTRPVRWQALLPCVLLLAGFALYKVIVLDREMSMAPNSGLVIWGELRNRVRALLIHPTTYFVRGFYAAPLVSLLAYAAPWALGLRPRRPQAAIPFLWTLGMILFYPNYLWGATNFYDRFAVLLYPTYAVMFTRAPAEARAVTPRREHVVAALLVAAVALVLGRETLRNLSFARESRVVDELLARLPPERRVLYIPLDPASRATGLTLPYFHYPLWYEARRHGLVEFNFATLLPQIVRYRDFRRHVDPEASWNPAVRMRWSRFEHDGYDYVLVRSAEAPGASMLDANTCRLVPMDVVGEWRLYRNACMPEPLRSTSR